MSAPAPQQTLVAAPLPQTTAEVLARLSQHDNSQYMHNLVNNWAKMSRYEREQTKHGLLGAPWVPQHIKQALRNASD